MKVAVLTSSRADYSIYLPLLRAMAADPFFETEIVAFGTHLSQRHGMTVDAIVADGFDRIHRLDTHVEGGEALHVSAGMARTMAAFSGFWSSSDHDLAFCLGDRFEMFAACAASVPFNIRLAHIHGGEETLGAIDEAFRHSITHMAAVHFAAAERYRQRIEALRGSGRDVHNVGALSMDNLRTIVPLTVEEFEVRFGIDLSTPTILTTFHPETVDYGRNEGHVTELIAALRAVEGYQLLITMPNADTTGDMIRRRLADFAAGLPHVHTVESLGTLGYVSCMRHCAFMLGNTSSGFIEAAYFPRYVVNLGERQRGRIVTDNIRNCPLERDAILEAVHAFRHFVPSGEVRIYGDGHTAERITGILKELHA